MRTCLKDQDSSSIEMISKVANETHLLLLRRLTPITRQGKQ